MRTRQQIPAKFDVIRMAFSAGKDRILASADFGQQEVRFLAVFTEEPSLIDAFQTGKDMHSTITSQVKGFNYEMFEEVRNYKLDDPTETQENINKIIDKWVGSEEIKFALNAYNDKYATDYQELNTEVIENLSAFFELSRKMMKPVLFGM